MFLNKTNI